MKFNTKYADEQLELRLAQYSNGRPAIVVVGAETGDQWAVLSVNIPEAELEEGEICIKNWSENAELAQSVYELGIFEDTCKSFRTGFVVAPVWKFKVSMDQFKKIS